MSGKQKLLFYSISFVLIIGGFWFFLFRGTDNWKSKLPVISYVKPFSFVNQSGDTVSQATTTGKVYIANYFFASCRGICPRMNGNLKKLYLEFKGKPDLLFISHTCQPEFDHVPQLKHYSDSIGADGRQWQFVTGDKLSLYATARESYHIDDPKNNVGSITDQFLHSQFIALVDRSGQVRGIYDGLKEKEISQLKVDIDDLLRESAGAVFVNGIFSNNPGL
jgi:protein SCO1/2